MRVPILYEDNHLLVVQKPVNVPVQEDNTGDMDVLTLLKNDLKIRYEKPGNVYLGLVHRLDRPVGGVMLFAKTSKAASRLSDQLRRQCIDREYLAVVRGNPPKIEGTLEHFLVKNTKENKVYTMPAHHKDAKQAILTYKTIGKTKNMSLVAVKLLTGRSHQIRVQLSAAGCPLYGDQKYGSNVNRPGQQIALWAHTIQFEHPTKKEIIKIRSNPPMEFPWNQWPALFTEQPQSETGRNKRKETDIIAARPI